MFIEKINYLLEIKSLYIIKDIFLFLEEKQKLNMIIYNKELQEILGVDIKDYKNISGKFKIGGKNGKGKEYIINTNNSLSLIFEGNGRRNGNGKEYYKGYLIFEGKYIDGKRNGKGKEYHRKGYNKKGIIEFGIKDGKGYIKIYDNSDILKYEGEYLNGERSGKGKEYYINQVKFEGEYLGGKKHGKGKKYYCDGKLKFEGEYSKGKNGMENILMKLV